MRIKASEADIQKAILDWLNCQPGVKVWRRNVGAVKGTYKGKTRFIRFGKKGMVDTEGIGPKGRHIEIEVKRTGEEPTDDQYDWLKECRHYGAIAFWADSLEMCIREWNSQLKADSVPSRPLDITVGS